jgi:hypothetical protein
MTLLIIDDYLPLNITSLTITTLHDMNPQTCSGSATYLHYKITQLQLDDYIPDYANFPPHLRKIIIGSLYSNAIILLQNLPHYLTSIEYRIEHNNMIPHKIYSKISPHARTFTYCYITNHYFTNYANYKNLLIISDDVDNLSRYCLNIVCDYDMGRNGMNHDYLPQSLKHYSMRLSNVSMHNLSLTHNLSRKLLSVNIQGSAAFYYCIRSITLRNIPQYVQLDILKTQLDTYAPPPLIWDTSHLSNSRRNYYIIRTLIPYKSR